MKCWLCEHGTNIDDGGLGPGEIKPNLFGDLECIYCTEKINFTAKLMANPKLIPLVVGIQKLPKVEGVRIGLEMFSEDDQ